MPEELSGQRSIPYSDLLTNEFIQVINRDVVSKISSSIFFPTFRRIEGGFSTTIKEHLHRRITGTAYFPYREHEELQQALVNLSSRISVYDHRFVSSISTDDIVELVTKKYADASESLNKNYQRFSTSIIDSISTYETELTTDINQDLVDAKSTLESIRKKAGKIDKTQSLLLQPFNSLSEIVNKIFRYKGIKITDNISLGDSINAIDSSDLSAGEKQMLSFLCYNAFTSNSPFFIDEPEISLHVDWQRILFPTLLKQNTGNQFIVATHSPLIYSKYSDKELMLN